MPPQPTFVVREAVPRLADDSDRESLREALHHSIAWLHKQPGTNTQHFGAKVVSIAAHLKALEAFDLFLATAPSAEDIELYLQAHFVVVEATAPVLFTGYYEPELDGSLTREPGYDAPIFGMPPDLLDISLGDFSSKLKGEHIIARIDGSKVVPYYTRAELPLTLPVIAWGKDPVDVFFAEIQGSATLRLPDGTTRRIGYAGKNGRAYRAVGGLLIKEGQIKKEDMSMQAIRTWLAAHPSERPRVLNFNESAVFFRFLDSAPLGALGVPVTPGRSIATDLSIMPRGALCYLSFDRIARLVLNQDTGGAIKGPARVDVFFGRGAEAAEVAGHLATKGKLLLLAPRE